MSNFLTSLLVDNAVYATIVCNLGCSYDKLGKHRIAVKILKKCIRLKDALGQIGHPTYSIMLSNFGTALKNNEEVQEAVRVWEVCRKLYQMLKNHDSVDYIITLENMGKTLHDSLQDHKRAVEVLEEARALRYRMHLNETEEYRNTLYFLAISLKKIGHTTRASEVAEEWKALGKDVSLDPPQILSKEDIEPPFVEPNLVLRFSIALFVVVLVVAYFWRKPPKKIPRVKKNK